eukprot:7817423-Ditylum_brightwellii.AAC.1
MKKKKAAVSAGKGVSLAAKKDPGKSSTAATQCLCAAQECAGGSSSMCSSVPVGSIRCTGKYVCWEDQVCKNKPVESAKQKSDTLTLYNSVLCVLERLR